MPMQVYTGVWLRPYILHRERMVPTDTDKLGQISVSNATRRRLAGWEERKESVVVEGVHLSLKFVMGLMKKHPSIIPSMIYITNEDKHLERFAVRAKYMTLDPEKNKYVKYIRNIRTIQEYLCNRADKHLMPKINNTNVPTIFNGSPKKSLVIDVLYSLPAVLFF
ncbi:hypothetical protein POM88_041868 [Heracleum sosnowskyi]|uniref:Uncharacterized protein n=1 Tax=Heracleum sosnowskyi TaxID=360622 RepID=A0AAD8HF84_9APIA|nr:hypothetical protein POM88_041868 [Heracleum sosnowskyi]